MKLKKFKKLVILGGDTISLDIIDFLKKNKINFFFITSKRNLENYKLFKNIEIKKNSVVTKSIKDLKKLKKFDSNETLFLCMTCPWIISKRTINSIKGKIINTHGVRLPYNRGGASVSWQILNRYKFGFSNLYLVNENVDAGPIMFFKEFLYPEGLRTPLEYMKFYKNIHVEFLKEKLLQLFSKNLDVKPIVQPEYLSTYWPRLNSEINSWIDWRMKFENLSSFIKAFDDPYNGAQTTFKNKKVYIKKCSCNYEDAKFHPFQSGIIYRKGPDWICVAANEGSVIIEEVFDKSGKNILKNLNVGDRFFTPEKQLSNTSKRIYYNSEGIKKIK